MASTTATGCSGTSAWLAFGITITLARGPTSSGISFLILRGVKGSSSPCRSRSGALPPDHHSDCFVARPASNCASSTSGCHPESHTLASFPGAKNAMRRYVSRSSAGSFGSPAFLTAADNSFAPSKPAGYALAAAAMMTTPRTSAGWSTAVMRATQLPKACPATTAGPPPSWRIVLATSRAKSWRVSPFIGPELFPAPRGCGRTTRNPARAMPAATASKSSESRPRDGSSTTSGPEPSEIRSIRTSPYAKTSRLRSACASAVTGRIERATAKSAIAFPALSRALRKRRFMVSPFRAASRWHVASCKARIVRVDFRRRGLRSLQRSAIDLQPAGALRAEREEAALRRGEARPARGRPAQAGLPRAQPQRRGTDAGARRRRGDRLLGDHRVPRRSGAAGGDLHAEGPGRAGGDARADALHRRDAGRGRARSDLQPRVPSQIRRDERGGVRRLRRVQAPAQGVHAEDGARWVPGERHERSAGSPGENPGAHGVLDPVERRPLAPGCAAHARRRCGDAGDRAHGRPGPGKDVEGQAADRSLVRLNPGAPCVQADVLLRVPTQRAFSAPEKAGLGRRLLWV